MEAQHAELQTAYRQIEERNETLAQMLKKVQVAKVMAKVMATVLVIGVFLGVSAYVWPPLGLFGSSSGPSVASRADAGVVEGIRTIMVGAALRSASDCALSGKGAGSSRAGVADCRQAST